MLLCWYNVLSAETQSAFPPQSQVCISNNKSLEKMQNEVDVWARQFEKPYFSPLSMIATMTEELGEVARLINIMYGDKNKKSSETLKSLEEELGDLMFTIICLANDQNISLSAAHEKKLEKLYVRDNNRFEKKKL